jgi:hypothetical protein
LPLGDNTLVGQGLAEQVGNGQSIALAGAV